MKIRLFLLVLVVFGISCSQQNKTENLKEQFTLKEDELLKKAKQFFQPIAVVAENPENPITENKVQLGKMLYFDTRLSKEGNISCNSCHNLSTFGVDNLPTSPGDAGESGARNSPTVFNAAVHTFQFWDGRAKDVEEQAGMPILNPVEMAIPHEAFLVERLSKIKAYKKLFAEAFPKEEAPLTYANLQKAIGAFERTLMTPSRFDAFLNGKDALNEQERKGLETFVNVGCTTCHIGPGVGGNMFQKFGLHHDYWEFTNSEKIDKGKFEVTGQESDMYIFKVPSLRNVTKTHPYFHDGSVASLEKAILIMAKTQLNKDLTDEEIQDIVTFMHTMTADIPEEAKQVPETLKNI